MARYKGQKRGGTHVIIDGRTNQPVGPKSGGAFATTISRIAGLTVKCMNANDQRDPIEAHGYCRELAKFMDDPAGSDYIPPKTPWG